MAQARDIERLRAANQRLEELWQIYCDREPGAFPPEGTKQFIQVRRAFFTGAALMRSQAVLELLQRISSWRPLSRKESDLLARYMRRQAPKRDGWHWKAEEDAKVLELIRKRAQEGRPRPYERNNEVRRLAKRLGRSPMAVHRRMERLRKGLQIPGNCSNGSEAPPSLNWPHEITTSPRQADARPLRANRPLAGPGGPDAAAPGAGTAALQAQAGPRRLETQQGGAPPS